MNSLHVSDGSGILPGNSRTGVRVSRGEQGASSRRMVLAGIGLGALAMAGAGSALSVHWAAKMNKKTSSWWDNLYPSLRHGGISQWSELVGQWFYFKGGRGGHAAYMVREVKPLPSKGVRPEGVTRTQAFIVVFQTGNVTRSTPGNQMVEISHERYPPLPIFVSAEARIGDKSMIHAVFN